MAATTLRELKFAVPIERVLQAFGLLCRLRSRGNDRLVGPCPIHSGADNPNAFVVSRSKNLWFCFTKCNRGGDVVALVRLLGNFSYAQTRRWLENIALSDFYPQPQNIQNISHAANKHSSAFRPYTRRLTLNTVHPFLTRMAIEPQTVKRFEAGYYTHPQGFLAECIGVRLHDTLGNPLGYAGRRLRQEDIERYGKWKVPTGLPKNQLLYNWHRANKYLPAPIVVTEGPWAVMKLAQAGFPTAVALLGVHLSPTRLKILQAADSPIILLLDADPAGMAASKRIAAMLGSRATAIYLNPQGNTDPDDLAESRLKAILRPLFGHPP